MVEYLGDEQLVHLSAGDRPLLAKLPIEERLSPGGQCGFWVPRDKLHLFDEATEERLPAA